MRSARTSGRSSPAQRQDPGRPGEGGRAQHPLAARCVRRGLQAGRRGPQPWLIRGTWRPTGRHSRSERAHRRGTARTSGGTTSKTCGQSCGSRRDFTNAGGVTRTALVSLDPTTGTATNQVNLRASAAAAATTLPASPGHQRSRPAPDCRRVVIIGNFTGSAGTSATRWRCSTCPRRPGTRRWRRGTAPTTCGRARSGWAPARAPARCRSGAAHIDWAPDGTWWALELDRRPPPVPVAVRLGQPLDQQRQHRRPASLDQLHRWGHDPERAGHRPARVRRRPLPVPRRGGLPGRQEGRLHRP